jgi:ATP-dependent RNA helicase DOB1
MGWIVCIAGWYAIGFDRDLYNMLTLTNNAGDKYLDTFQPTLMEVVYLWSKGMTFQSICEATDIFEGSVVRALRRLYELLDSLDMAAQVVGDTGLSERFKKSKESIRKGLPFAASLYI